MLKKTKILIFFFWVIIFNNSNSQNLLTNNGLALTNQTGMVATIQGGFTNKTNGADLGTIDNAGGITLTGDWTNNSANTVFSTNSGSVQFNGTAAAQTINGTNATVFYNLQINNTFATSPQVVLGVNTTAKNTLTMTAGNINLAGFAVTLGTTAASPGTLTHGLTSASGWMYGGSFIRYRSASTIADGSVDGLFPMGTSTNNFRPIYITAPAVAPTTGGNVTVSHTGVAASAASAFADTDAKTIERVSNSFWTLTTGGGLAGGTYNLQTEGTGFGVVYDVNHLRLTRVASVVGIIGTNAGTTSNPQVNRTSLTLAELSNTFYWGTIDQNNTPLPIQLLNFKAENRDKYVALNWATATEKNTDYFLVERSADAEKWTSILKVKAAENSNQTLYYEDFDREPLNGVSYYRLKSIDKDLSESYSSIEVVERTKKEGFVIFYPNPTNGDLNIASSFNSSDLKYELYNLAGQLVKINVTEINESKVVVDTSPLAKGMYFLTVYTPDGQQIKDNKIIIR